MSATVTTDAFTAGERFERLCGSMETRGYADRLFKAAAAALGSNWAIGGSAASDARWIEHRSGQVRVTLVDGVFHVAEFDVFGFEVGEVTFAQHKPTQRRILGPRALRYASQLAAEVAR